MKSAANGRCMVEQKPHEILLPLETATRLALVAAGIGLGLARRAAARGRAGGWSTMLGFPAAPPGRAGLVARRHRRLASHARLRKGTFLGSRDPVSAAASGSGPREPGRAQECGGLLVPGGSGSRLAGWLLVVG